MDHAGPTLHQLRHNPSQVVSIRAPIDGEEHKVHPGYMHPVAAPSMLQRLRTRLAQAHQVSLPVCLALCFLCLWGGSNLSFESTLPTPTSGSYGPHNTQQASKTSRSLKFSIEAAHNLDAAARAPATVAQQVIMTESDLGEFQSVALNRSGFLNVRPAIGHGASGEDAMRAIPFQVISWYPRITYYPSFMDLQQTQHVIALAKTFMAPSTLAYRPGESIPETQEVRTSTGCFLSAEMDRGGILAQVEDKIAAVTHLPVEHGEAFNVLRYDNGQHYDSHLDAFDPASYGKQPSQRIATMLIFLQAPEEGGETVFKREGEDGSNRTIADWRTCADNLGIKVTPKSGDAVLFWSTTVDGQLDLRSLHGACPVVRGQKWSMAKWMRDKPSGPHRRTLKANRH